MSRGSILCSVYVLISLITIYTFYNLNDSFNLKFDNKFIVTYLPNTTGISIYQPITPNTMKANFTTVNTIISNMISSGDFYIERDYSKDNLLDIVLSNGEEEYRILYNRRTRDYMCMSNPFLKNYVPQTYIHK